VTDERSEQRHNFVVRGGVRRARVVIGVWVVLAAACLPFMLRLAGELTTGGVTNPRGDSIVGQQTVERAFHEPPTTLQVVLHDPSGDATAAVAPIRKALKGFPDVVAVTLRPEWTSADRHTTFLQLGLRTGNDDTQDLLGDLRAGLSTATDVSSAVSVDVTGAAALDHDLTHQVLEDAATAELIAFPLLLVVLLLVFRSVVSMLVPLVLAGVALAAARAGGYFLAQATDISVMYTSAASIIGLAVAVDYSLFIVKRYRDELTRTVDERAALDVAMRTAGRSVLFSGFAVIVALVALFIPRLVFFTSIGLAGIVVTLVSMAMSMTLLPAILLLLGRRVNVGAIRLGGRGFRTGDGSSRLVGRLVRRPVPLLLVLVAFFCLLAWPITAIRMQIIVAGTELLPADSDARQGADRLAADLDPRGLFPLQVVLTADAPEPLLDSVTAAAAFAGRQAESGTVRSVADLDAPVLAAGVAGQLPPQGAAAFDQLWARDGDRYVSRVLVMPRDGPNSNATHDLVRALRDGLPGVVAPGVDQRVTGATAQGADFDDAIIGSLPAILGTVALVTFVLLARAFRSLLLPLLSLALNTMVVGASLGLLTLVCQLLLGQPINSNTPVLLFAVMFGLSMDYLVIMISRMREHFLAGNDHRAAVVDGLARTSGLVNGAALIMVAVFVSFLTAEVNIVAQLGLGLAIAVLLDALLVRLLVMPAALLLIGPRVWGRAARPAAGPLPERAQPVTAR